MNADTPQPIFLTAGLTHAGRVRSYNEDSFATLPELGLWVVADGMGGHAAGDVASSIITGEMASLGIAVSAADQRARFLERTERAHRRIRAHTEQNGLEVVGATIAALLVFGAELTCAWAGDSRVYLMRQGRLTQLTRDHSEVAALLAGGAITEEEARVSPRRNVITRAIGIGNEAQPEMVTGVAQPGDRFLICSDGLTEHLGDEDLARLLNDSAEPCQIVERLIALALERGGHDNVTAIVTDCIAFAAAPENDVEQ
ncbi:MAG: protein phosphatase 2C domain-containing protein [Paracoccus sp. (in: a-proteobacteria)]|nr:protein phosphatase 2C domain-containing protein [Paracoccus sp. (in: a-proteobacteria)]